MGSENAHRWPQEKNAWALFRIFLSKIVTGYEMWISGYEMWISHVISESKQQSMRWQHLDSLRGKIFKHTLLDSKVMCTVFRDRQGVLHVEFMLQGTNITDSSYCQSLEHMKRLIRIKQRRILSMIAMFLHNNACPHTVTQTCQLIESFKWEVLAHSPYSPGPVP